jgi:membrane protein
VKRLLATRAGRLLATVWRRWKQDELNDIAAGVAFWVVLSLPPAALALAAILGWLELVVGEEVASDVRAEVIRLVEDGLETTNGPVREALVDILERPRGAIAVVGFVIAVYSMSKGFAALFRGLARIHGHPGRRSNLRGRAVALGFGLATVGVIVVLLLSSVVGPLLGFEKLLPNEGGVVVTIWAWVRVPVLGGAIVAWLAVLLSTGPGTGVRWRQAVPGAALTAVLWVLVTVGFDVYLRVSGGGNVLLGVLGGILVALTWLYLLVVALVLGGLLNAALLAELSGAPVEDERSVVAAADRPATQATGRRETGVRPA